MIFPALPNTPPLLSELTLTKQRLLSVRAALHQACRDLDAQISGLDRICSSPLPFPPEEISTAPAASLFESPPAMVTEDVSVKPAPAANLVLAATSPLALDPLLEQATLEELNSALSKAFAQIAGRPLW